MSSHVNFWPGNPHVFSFSDKAMDIISECPQPEPIDYRQIQGKGKSRTFRYIRVLAVNDHVIKLIFPIDCQMDSWKLARMCRFILIAFPKVFQNTKVKMHLAEAEVPLTFLDIGSNLDQLLPSISEGFPASLPPIFPNSLEVSDESHGYSQLI